LFYAFAIVPLALLVLFASRPGTVIRGCPDGCASESARRPGPLRVLSLNVLHGFPDFDALDERLELIAREIQTHDADVVCLQEVPWTPLLGSAAAWLAERTGMNHVSFRANGNRHAILFEEGAAILSRFPLHGAQARELTPRAGFFEQRIALYARVDTSQGELGVVSTHLTNGAPETNRKQARALQNFVAQRAGPAFVVAGDLNAQPGSPQIRALASVWVDSFAVARPGVAGPTCCHAGIRAPPAPLRQRIDYLFVSQRAVVRSSRRVLAEPVATEDGWLAASDHAGLLSELDIRE
jgi:endonuclease/exonuclease/phosphatase family metal-dependent hydrolase